MSKDPHPLRIPLALLAVSLAGFVGMFLTPGFWDLPMFALSVLPIVVGLARLRRQVRRPAAAVE